MRRKISRYERIINLTLALLAAKQPRTLAQLVQLVPGYPDCEDETVRTAFERDKKILRGEGLQIETDETRGSANAAYRIGRSEQAHLDADLTQDERASLAIALRSCQFEHPARHAAMAKLASAMRDSAGATSLPTNAVEVLVQFAIASRRAIRFVYEGRNRDVEPYGLSSTDTGVVMVGRDQHLDGAQTRCYRIDRMSSAPILGNSNEFALPSQFDPRHRPFGPTLALGAEPAASKIRAIGAAARFRRLIAMLTYLAEVDEASLEELSSCFHLRQSEVAAEMEFAACCGVAPFTPDRLLDLVVGKRQVVAYNIETFKRPSSLTQQECVALIEPTRMLLAIPGLVNRACLESALVKVNSALGQPGDRLPSAIDVWPREWSEFVHLEVDSITPELASVVVDGPKLLDSGARRVTVYLADRRWRHLVANRAESDITLAISGHLSPLPIQERRAA